jgi:hypothetical protein
MKKAVLYRHALWGGALALALLGPPVGSARAGFLQAFSGNARAANPEGTWFISGNFAVLDRLSGASSPGDVFGTGLPGFDSLAILGTGSPAFNTSARYLYLYQEVTLPTSLPTGSGFIYGGVYGDGQAHFSSVTSFAQWSLFLSDNRGIVSFTNDFGSDGAPFTPSAPANLGVVNPSVASDPSGSSLIPVSPSVSSTAFTVTGTITPGSIDRLHGFTTDAPPELLTEPVVPGYPTWTYPIPEVPEPSSLLLGSIAWMVGLCVYIQRTWKCRWSRKSAGAEA